MKNILFYFSIVYAILLPAYTYSLNTSTITAVKKVQGVQRFLNEKANCGNLSFDDNFIDVPDDELSDSEKKKCSIRKQISNNISFARYGFFCNFIKRNLPDKSVIPPGTSIIIFIRQFRI